MILGVIWFVFSFKILNININVLIVFVKKLYNVFFIVGFVVKIFNFVFGFFVVLNWLWYIININIVFINVFKNFFVKYCGIVV